MSVFRSTSNNGVTHLLRRPRATQPRSAGKRHRRRNHRERCSGTQDDMPRTGTRIGAGAYQRHHELHASRRSTGRKPEPHRSSSYPASQTHTTSTPYSSSTTTPTSSARRNSMSAHQDPSTAQIRSSESDFEGSVGQCRGARYSLPASRSSRSPPHQGSRRPTASDTPPRQERIDFANEHAALIATATATEVERYERPETRVALPIQTSTPSPSTLSTAVPSPARRSGSRHRRTRRSPARSPSAHASFLATHDTSRDQGWSPTDVARVPPYVDDACTPTIALRETSPRIPRNGPIHIPRGDRPRQHQRRTRQRRCRTVPLARSSQSQRRPPPCWLPVSPWPRDGEFAVSAPRPEFPRSGLSAGCLCWSGHGLWVVGVMT